MWYWSVIDRIWGRSMQNFSKIEISDWRNLKDLVIRFHPSLTIITGPNGSGKSTILSLVASNLEDERGQGAIYLATPVDDEKTGERTYSASGWWSTVVARTQKLLGGLTSESKTEDAATDPNLIGTLTYGDEQECRLKRPAVSDIQYQIVFEGAQKKQGFQISSHRASPRYQKIDSIPFGNLSLDRAFSAFKFAQNNYGTQNTYHGESRRQLGDPLLPFKEILIGFAGFGSDNSDMKADPEVKGMFQAFQETLRKTLPREIGFKSLEVRRPELILKTDTGEFPIDGASGGLMSVMQVVWQIFLYTKSGNNHPTIVLDEPENHLHPSLQREFLRNLVTAFPQVQFVVATHSPFIVSSVRDAHVYALRALPVLPEKNRTSEVRNSSSFTAEMIDLKEQAGPATQVLSEVLGVPITLPIWAEEDLVRIIEKYEARELSQALLREMKEELETAGLGRLFPEALAGLAR